MPAAVVSVFRPVGVWVIILTFALTACLVSLQAGHEVRVLLEVIKLYFVTGARG